MTDHAGAEMSKACKVAKPKYDPNKLDGEPYERFLVVVGWTMGQGPDRFILQSKVDADMGIEPPNPPISVAEMQSVCYAAKMALWKVLRARKKTGASP
jgi:hypothetical protein